MRSNNALVTDVCGRRCHAFAFILLSVIASAAVGRSEAGDPFLETTTQVSKASKLRPLDSRPSRAGDELRIWVFTLAVVNKFVVVREDPAAVRGELRLWWGQVPGRTFARLEDEQRRTNARNREWIRRLWGCGEHRVQSLLEVCRVAFHEQPDWSQFLRRLEQEKVWDLPDGSTLKPTADLADGVTLVVELRRGNRTRVYSYSNPKHLTGPDARNAERILSIFWDFVRALEAKKGILR